MGIDALVDAACMAAGLMLFRAISAPGLSTWSLLETVTFPLVVVAMAVRGWVGTRRDAKQWRQLADLERASAHDLDQAEAVVRFQERPAGVDSAMLALRWAATAQVIEGRTGRVALAVGLVCAVALAPLFGGVWLWSWVLAGAMVALWAALVVRRGRHLRRRVEELHEDVDAQ